ncbi:CidA/LrgA family protein [Diplocloster agilis]|uniref:CidA/LrgA family protein n=1 Tax=Diplocloster agilis TaxID=2850323 RepID=UPI00130D84F1|nr:CidA/LrgA family protein [Suonthocola fibrivorans]MCU6734700.1 CidA/LrgA family protein [Suonthocola fibrivorans]
MKYVKQILIILGIALAGELLRAVIPLPIPGSIYGLAILFFLLFCNLLKPEQIQDAGKLLIDLMPLMFIPAGVGLMKDWQAFAPLLLPASVITVVSTLAVTAVSAGTTRFIRRRRERRTI